MPFHELHAALRAHQADGLVKVATHPEATHLELWCYTKDAEYGKRWDPITEMARGLVLDVVGGTVLATPLTKFFNYGERTLSIPAGRWRAYDKLDGSYGVTFWDGYQWRVATKGSLTSPQSQWATTWLHANVDPAVLTRGDTYLFEIIYAQDQKVVRYDFEGMVLLAGYNSNGIEFAHDDVKDLADRAKVRVAESFEFESFDEMLEAVTALGIDREGVVVRFDDDTRMKIKGDEYKRVHRLISRVTPLAVWEMMLAGTDLGLMRKELPEEFLPDFDAIVAVMAKTHAAHVAAVDAAVIAYAHLTDKELGLRLRELGEVERSFIFAARRGGATWATTTKARVGLIKLFRPTGNTLPGYEPTKLLNRVLNTEGTA